MTTENPSTRTLVTPVGRGGSPQPYRPQSASRWGSALRHAVMIIVVVISLYPVLWMVVSSLRPEGEIFGNPSLILTDFEWENYAYGWNALGTPFGTYLLNSGVIVLGSIVGNLFSCSLAAYAFARLRFRFQRPAFAYMLVTLMLPIHVVIVPQYILWAQLGLNDSFWPLIVPKFLATDAFFIFLMVQFIRGLPKELDEAARIDGAGHARIFFSIMLPLIVPTLTTVAIFTFLGQWNDFFGPLLYLTSPENYPLSMALKMYNDQTSVSDYGATTAASFIALVPVLLFFVIFQRFIITGMSSGAVKG